MRPSVLIAYKSLPRYRVDFFSGLRDRLAADGVDLVLTYGQPTSAERLKHDTAELEWAIKLRNRAVPIGGREVIWQPCLRQAGRADLVIVEQASRLLVNYALLLMQQLGRTKVAFWGHGANLQRHRAHGGAERLKRLVSRFPHWWFAYSDDTKARVAQLGFPESRITVVQNAIDTRKLAAGRKSNGAVELAEFRERHALGDGPVGVFVGGLYAEKRLRFLFEACDRVVERVPDFRLVVIGDGPDATVVRDTCASRPWARALGPQFGREKVLALSSARTLLMPGLVGLAVLDSFGLDAPLVTTAVDGHGPEIAYLEDGVNGLIVDSFHDAGAYAHAIVELLTDDRLHARLVAGCREAASRYTIEAMIERFAQGVHRALEAA